MLTYKYISTIIFCFFTLFGITNVNTTQAQSNDAVEVVFSVEQIRANNLNEDSLFDDQVDEMDFTFEVYEVNDNGLVLQHIQSSYSDSFRTDETVGLGSTTNLRMVVDQENSVFIVISAIERDDDASGRCGAYGTGELIECVFGTSSGDCNIELETAIHCLNALDESDLFENAFIAAIELSNYDERSYTVQIEDVGINSAEYDVTFNLNVNNSTTPASRTSIGRREIFFGTISDDNWIEVYTLRLVQGERITVIATPTSGDLDTVVALFDVSEEPVTSNDDAEEYETTNSLFEYHVTNTGVYYLAVFRYNGDEGDSVGDYFIEVIYD